MSKTFTDTESKINEENKDKQDPFTNNGNINYISYNPPINEQICNNQDLIKCIGQKTFSSESD